jgi:hypothetical protein
LSRLLQEGEGIGEKQPSLVAGQCPGQCVVADQVISPPVGSELIGKLVRPLFGAQTGQLAIQAFCSQRGDFVTPGIQRAGRSVGFGRMIDHDRQIRPTTGEAPEHRQMTRLHERIEAQAVCNHRLDRRIEAGAKQPVSVVDRLEHWAQAAQLRIRGQFGDAPRRLGRCKIDPSHNSLDPW